MFFGISLPQALHWKVKLRHFKRVRVVLLATAVPGLPGDPCYWPNFKATDFSPEVTPPGPAKSYHGWYSHNWFDLAHI